MAHASIPVSAVAVSALQESASPCFSQIDHDLLKLNGDEGLCRFLETMKKRLFDFETTVAALKRWAEVRDKSLVTRFRTKLGRAPKAYLVRCRLETAKLLLQDPRLRIWQIAELVGYSSIGVFSKAFDRYQGVRPLAFRKQAKDRQRPVKELPLGFRGTEFFMRVLRGEVEPREAQKVIERLQSLYPQRTAAKGMATLGRAS